MPGDKYRDKGKRRQVEKPTADSLRQLTKNAEGGASSGQDVPLAERKTRKEQADKNERRRIKGTRQPPDGNETEGELEAAEKHRRLDFLQRLVEDTHKSISAAKLAHREEATQERRDDLNALKKHLKALRSLTALKQSGFDKPEHKLHHRWEETLAEYRKSKQDLKTYGRYEKTFVDSGSITWETEKAIQGK